MKAKIYILFCMVFCLLGISCSTSSSNPQVKSSINENQRNKARYASASSENRPWKKRRGQRPREIYSPLEGDTCARVNDFCNQCIRELDFPDIRLLARGKDKKGASPSIALRYAARYIHVSMCIGELTRNPDRKKKFFNYAVTGLDTLMKMQRKSGVFPAPDVRHTGSKFGKYQARLIGQGLAEAKDGWIIKDNGFGGFQHDIGIIGRAFIKGYMIFGDERYLHTARKAAVWLKKCPVVKNWNYNASGAHLLSDLYKVKKEPWIKALMKEKMEKGVLPFQTASGNWADRHNSKLVYHHILLASLISVYNQWPDHDAFKKRLKTAIQKAEEYVHLNTRKRGATQSWQAVTNFVDAQSSGVSGPWSHRSLMVHLARVVSENDLMNLFAAIKYHRAQCTGQELQLAKTEQKAGE